MKKILILTNWYLPGQRAGGPIRTLFNLTDALGDEYEFFIACLDRDHGDTAAYPGIRYGEWNPVGKAKVWYVPAGQGFRPKTVLHLAQGMDLIYCCSFYDDYGRNALFLNGRKKLHGIPVVIAPMGVFSPGALAQKRWKKRVYIALMKCLGLFRNMTWSVTSEKEAEDLKRVIGEKAAYTVAEDLPRMTVPGFDAGKRSGNRIVFLSRICPMKNLLGAVAALRNLTDEVIFDIYGPKEDLSCWAQCEAELKTLPPHIRWSYCGEIPTERVQETLSRYDIFLLPTLGENYGHVIFEALSVGCVPVISDQTPWTEAVGNGCGFALPLREDMTDFSAALTGLLHEDAAKREERCRNAVRIAEARVEENKKETGYRRIFGRGENR